MEESPLEAARKQAMGRSETRVKITGKTGILKETPPFFSVSDECTATILLEASHARLLLLKNNYQRARVAAGIGASVPVDMFHLFCNACRLFHVKLFHQK